MKPTKLQAEKETMAAKQSVPPPPPSPPLPPLPRFYMQKTSGVSVTNQEIAKFWRKKRIEEEDHLLAAIKAAARLRARNLTEEDYKKFEESLKDDDDNGVDATTDDCNKEVRVGIKDWWTKSKYAYLNEPALETKDPHKRKSSNYIPNCLSFNPTPLYPTSLGVF